MQGPKREGLTWGEDHSVNTPAGATSFGTGPRPWQAGRRRVFWGLVCLLRVCEQRAVTQRTRLTDAWRPRRWWSYWMVREEPSQHSGVLRHVSWPRRGGVCQVTGSESETG